MQSFPFALFGARLAERRGAILAHWRKRVRNDPRLPTGSSLPRTQLDDHLTAMLEDFERRLRADGSGAVESVAQDQQQDAAAHGLHRWQQGYEMAELARELGRLNESMVAEIDRCGQEPGLDAPGLAAKVRAAWAEAHALTVSESAERFAELRRVEAAVQVQHLEGALASLRNLEAERAELWQQAAHDLRGNVGGVVMAATGLARRPEQRDRFLASLGTNVRSLVALLHDVTTLARLQGGQEALNAGPMDAGRVLRETVESSRPLADERQLGLSFDGPEPFVVEGDEVKTGRIVQNLLVNGLRYTEHGRVQVSWGDDPTLPEHRWFVQVADTGPGITAAQGHGLRAAISAASEHSKRVAEAESRGSVVHAVPDEASAGETDGAPTPVPGEGIGLSIVKRLCGLLGATLELESRAGEGSTFRVVLPKRYAV